MRTVEFKDLAGLVGQELGVSDWVEVSRQEFPEVYWLQGSIYVVEYRTGR